MESTETSQKYGGTSPEFIARGTIGTFLLRATKKKDSMLSILQWESWQRHERNFLRVEWILDAFTSEMDWHVDCYLVVSCPLFASAVLLIRFIDLISYVKLLLFHSGECKRIFIIFFFFLVSMWLKKPNTCTDRCQRSAHAWTHHINCYQASFQMDFVIGS